MCHRHGLVAASAVDHIQIGELGHGVIAASQTVDDDFAARVNCPDGSYGTSNQCSVIFSGHAIVAGGRWLVDEVKAEIFTWHTLVATCKFLPQENEGFLGNFVTPKIMLFEIVPIRAEAGSTVQIHTQMNAARTACLQILIDIAKDAFIGMKVIKAFGPKSIIEGNADEVKSELR